ncbi:hypothetical protein ACWEOE_22170 [Amycolatopsis sp. NPDC004368]
MSKVVWLAGLALVLTACGAPAASGPEVASLSTPSTSAASTATSSPASADPDGGRPRHRVDESPEDSQRLIEPWNTCMKAHDADPDQQPHSIAGAEQWSRDHAAAGDACRSKLPLLPWGEDPANPAYKDNLHRWVECMTSKGMHVAEDPDPASESPWHYTSDNQPPNSADIEQGCEVQVMGPSDK